MLRSFTNPNLDDGDFDEEATEVVQEGVQGVTEAAPPTASSSADIAANDLEMDIVSHPHPVHVPHHHKPLETLMPHPSPAAKKKKKTSSRVAQPPTPGGEGSPSSSDTSEDEEEEKEKERKRRQKTQEVERMLKTIGDLSVPDIQQRLKDFKFDRRKSSDFIMAAIRSQKPNSDETKLEVLKLLDAAGLMFTVAEDDVAGDLPIHAAASMDSISLVDFCAGYFVTDPFLVTNKEGNTVLHVTSQYGAMKVIHHIRTVLSDDEFVKLVRTRNRAGLTCFDCACERFLIPTMYKRKEESLMEYRLRSAKEANARVKRREEIQTLFMQRDKFYLPVVFYHPDCLEHLATPTSMQKEYTASQQDQEQTGGSATQPGGGVEKDGATGNEPQQQPLKKRKKRQSDPSEAWESPDRLKSIMAHLMPLANGGKIKITQDFASADRATLELAHSKEYVDFVHKLANDLSGSGDVVPFTPQVQAAIQKLEPHELKSKHMCDTGFSEGTFKAATRAAGSVCAAIDSVLKQETRRAFCVVRPPGHHAGRNGLLDESTSCGFCVFNNVMVGALHAMKTHKVKKVAIVDLDVHHGNGTEEICREFHNKRPPGAEPQILFLSTHLHDRTPHYSEEGAYNYEFYPGTGDVSDLPHNVVNVALKPLWRRRVVENTRSNWAETFYLEHWGRQEFRRVIEERVLPPLRAFHPDLILVSAGFDAAHKDLGNCRFLQKQLDGFDLQREDFFWVASEIAKIAELCCEGKMVSVLEGGYGRMCDTHSTSLSPTPPPISQPVAAVPTSSTTTSTGAIAITGGALPSSASSSITATAAAPEKQSTTAQRRGQSTTKIDRDVLARNVQGFIEGLCGGFVPAVPKQTLQALATASSLAADEESEEGNNDGESDNDIGGDGEEGTSLPDFLNSDEGLILGAARRSGRNKRPKRAAAAAAGAEMKARNESEKPRAKKRAHVDEDAGNHVGKLADVHRDNAIKYLRKLRETNEHDYKQFAALMANLRSKTMDMETVIQSVKTLFAGKPELITGFNLFLPAGFRIRE